MMSTQNELVTIPSAAIAALRAKAALADAPVWRPSEGETLEGILHGHRQVQNPFGQLQHQALVKTFDGRVMALWLSSWMIGQLKANQADMGDLVSITCQGTAKSLRGSSYNRFSLAVVKAG